MCYTVCRIRCRRQAEERSGLKQMKKGIGILAGLAAAAGLFLLALGAWFRSSQASVAVIGGADGPTSIFVAAKVNGAALTGAGLAVLAVGLAAGIVLAAVRRKRKKGSR